MGKLCRPVIANFSGQWCHQREAPLDPVLTAFLICPDTLNAFFSKGLTGIPKDMDGCKGFVGDQGMHHVKFQRAGLTSDGNGKVFTIYISRRLNNHFRNDWIDFPGHNGTARLKRWESYFSETGPGPTGKETKVTGNSG
jgi:hypothetical protein